MDKGSYCKLDRICDVEIQLTEASSSQGQEEPGYELFSGKGAKKKHIDYVLVYETCREGEVDEQAAAQAEKLARWRRNFEGYLTKRQGLLLKHKTMFPEEVLLISLC